MTPQNAKHYSMAQVQVNKLQTFSVQQMGIYPTVYSVIQYNVVTLSVFLKGYYSYKLQFMVHTAISSVMLTTGVNYSLLIVQGDKIH